MHCCSVARAIISLKVAACEQVSHMTMITIPLSDEHLAQLRTWAEQAGLSPEEFLRRRVEQLLEQPDERFRRAATYVLEKNAELYRRLA
jgi:antitoxin FitA